MQHTCLNSIQPCYNGSTLFTKTQYNIIAENK